MYDIIAVVGAFILGAILIYMFVTMTKAIREEGKSTLTNRA